MIPSFCPLPLLWGFYSTSWRGLLVSDPSGVGGDVKDARRHLTYGPSWDGGLCTKILRLSGNSLSYWASVTSTRGKAKAPLLLAVARSQLLPLFLIIHDLPPAFSDDVPSPDQAAI